MKKTTVIKSLIGITFNARKDTIEKSKLNLSYHILIENTRENHFNGTLTLEGGVIVNEDTKKVKDSLIKQVEELERAALHVQNVNVFIESVSVTTSALKTLILLERSESHK